MAPHQNTRSGLRSSQQVQDEQSHKNNLSGSRPAHKSKTRSQIKTKAPARAPVSKSKTSRHTRKPSPVHALSTKVEDAKPDQNKSSSSRSKSSPLIEVEQPYKSASSLQVEDKQPCYLLDAHPEIRNEIYRLVLVSDGRIEVGADDALPLDPPLLRTNRQIRSEARGIFYKENTVKITVLDYDVRKIVKWVDQSPAHHDMCTKMHLQLFVSSSWIYCFHAMLNWAYAYFQGRCGRLTLESSSLAPNDANAKDVNRLEVIAMFDALENHPLVGRSKSDPDTVRMTISHHHGNNMKGTLWWDRAPLRHFSYETLYWDKYWLHERAPSPHDPFGLRKGPLAPSPSALTGYMNAPAPPLPYLPFPMFSGPMNGGPRPM